MSVHLHASLPVHVGANAAFAVRVRILLGREVRMHDAVYQA
jgi:hypothetical protein